MIESLNTIRSLGLAPVFEDLYFGREVPAGLSIYMRYPGTFHDLTMKEGGPLTKGGLIPIVDDGSGDTICLFDPAANRFVLKAIDDPREIVRTFASWQQYLAYALLQIADSGLDDEELMELAQVTGFTRARELAMLLREMESLPDDEVDERSEQFIAQSDR